MDQPNDLGIPGLNDVRKVGSGGFAVVYQARDEFDRSVAVKVLKVLDERVTRRFDRERSAMGQVAGHPNIVTPFTSGYTTVESKPFVIMEYLAGGSLQDLLERRGPLPIEEAIGFIVPIAEALSFSHNAGIVHKDVKPGNILLTSDGIPKLADFGISSIRDGTATTSVGYSLDYTPPETFHGVGAAEGDPRDGRSDLYSLAATLYTLISGHGPFHSDTNATAAGYMARILGEPVPPTGSAALDAFLNKAMAKDPNQRFQTADAFAQALRSLPIDGSGSTRSTPPPASPPSGFASPVSPAAGISQADWAPPQQPSAAQPLPAVAPSPAAFTPPRPAAVSGSLDTDQTQVAGRSDSIVGAGPPSPDNSRLLLIGGVLGAFLLLLVSLVAWQGLRDDGSEVDASSDTTESLDTEPSDDGDDGDDGDATTTTTEGDDDVQDEITGEPEPLGDLPAFDGNGQTIRIAVSQNQAMEEIQDLTPSEFTAETNVNVEFVTVDFNAINDLVSAPTGEFDAVMIGMFETPQRGADGSLLALNDFAADTPAWQMDDIAASVRGGLSHAGSLYAAPFYAESSFLMYRQDVLDEFGLTMPSEPTWQEVAEIARAIDQPEMAGICLRGRPGWGDLGASLGTVLNTFGATWWAAEDDGSIGAAQVDQPEFREAFQFYVDLASDAGQDNVAESSFNECLSLYQNGEVAMWLDSTFGSFVLEDSTSPVRGLNGYAQSPTELTDASGWLWSWGLAIPTNAPDPAAAWAFVSWATSRNVVEARADALGWQREFGGTRLSTFDNPNYQAVHAANGAAVRQALVTSPIDNPGTSPRPGVAGVQYVGVPEFQVMANECTIEFAQVFSGQATVDDVLARCQTIASSYSP